jgi:predicted site-specific integrase-resolvase
VLPPADISEVPRWYTVAEVCELLHIRRSTWDKWRARGVAPRAKRLPNGQLRIREDWLVDWLEHLPDVAA